jgi:TldD protein
MDVDIEKLQKYLSEAVSLGAEYCSIRLQETWETSLLMKERRIDEFVSGGKHGASMVVLAKGAFGLASVSPRRLGELPKRAYGSAVMSQKLRKERVRLADVKAVRKNVRIKAKKDMDMEERMSLVAKVEKSAREAGADSVEVSCKQTLRNQLLITSEGTMIETALPYTRFDIQVDITKDGRGSYSERLGHVGGFEIVDEYNVEEIATNATRRAKEIAEAKETVSGKFPVVISGRLSSVLAHESLGHMAEADIVIAGSKLKGKIGKKIASDQVTIIDDGTQKEGFGFYPIDDEGVEGQKTVIVEKGVLKSYLHSRSTAHHFSVKPTGNARALYAEDLPIVRMTNTFFEKGNYGFDELLELMKNGLFLRGVRGGGQASSQTGEFTYGVMEAFRVQKGEIKGRVKSGSITGNILDALKKVKAVENKCSDPRKDISMCGKDTQFMPVGTGNPSLFISEVLIGGE